MRFVIVEYNSRAESETESESECFHWAKYVSYTRNLPWWRLRITDNLHKTAWQSEKKKKNIYIINKNSQMYKDNGNTTKQKPANTQTYSDSIHRISQRGLGPWTMRRIRPGLVWFPLAACLPTSPPYPNLAGVSTEAQWTMALPGGDPASSSRWCTIQSTRPRPGTTHSCNSPILARWSDLPSRDD